MDDGGDEEEEVVAAVTGFLVVAVTFLRDERVVRRFTAIVDVDAAAVTGFRVVVFITVVLFDGFGDAVGRLVGFELVPAADSVETDVRGGTGFLVAVFGFVGFGGRDVTLCVVLFVSFLIDC